MDSHPLRPLQEGVSCLCCCCGSVICCGACSLAVICLCFGRRVGVGWDLGSGCKSGERRGCGFCCVKVIGCSLQERE
jgi:hypothetical protein